jgi:hypothetical protein
MPTFADLVDSAARAGLLAKVERDFARDAAKAAPADAGLRAAAVAAEVVATTTGRKLAGLRFEEAVELEVDRLSTVDAVPPDELLVGLAPRDPRGGGFDAYWVAAATLSRRGVSVPKSWRSPCTGAPLHDHFDQEPNSG